MRGEEMPEEEQKKRRAELKEGAIGKEPSEGALAEKLEACRRERDSLLEALQRIGAAIKALAAEELVEVEYEDLEPTARKLMERIAADFKRLSTHYFEFKEGLEEMSLFVHEVLDNLQKVSGGDLTVRIRENVRNIVLGQLAKGLNQTLESFGSVIKDLRDLTTLLAKDSELLLSHSEQLDKMAQQVSKTVEEVAKSSEEQSKLSEEAKKVTTEISNAIQNVAKLSQDTAAITTQLNQSAQVGGKAAEEGITKLIEIRSSVVESSQLMAKLGEKGREIRKIVDVITRIADQTNLLALNAAIEAARAGEAGRGFAVVADEVRKLAESSASAAEKISDLIGEVQESTEKTVKSMEIAVAKVDEGAKIISAALTSLREIGRAAPEVAERVQEVSAANQQQTLAVQRIVEMVTNVATVAEQNAAGAQEISAATQQEMASIRETTQVVTDLNQRAKELAAKVKRFKLKEAPILEAA